MDKGQGDAIQSGIQSLLKGIDMPQQHNVSLFRDEKPCYAVVY